MKKIVVGVVICLAFVNVCHSEEDEYIYSVSAMSVQKLPQGFILYLSDWKGNVLGVYFSATEFSDFRRDLSLVRFNKFWYIERQWD